MHLKRQNSQTETAGLISRVLRSLVQAVFPSRCLACGQLFHPREPMPPDEKDTAPPLKAVFQDQMHPFLCRACLPAFTPVDPPLCHQCGRPFQSRAGDSHLCGDCISTNRYFKWVRSAGIYEGALMKVVHALKYSGKIQLALPLGRLLFQSFMRYDELARMDLIVPIPLHGSRMRKRGFNQAQLLLREWPALAEAQCRIIHIAPDLLIRRRKTLAQTGLGKEERKTNIRGAFSIRDTSRITGKQVLLVDDVYTTGATSEECARVLMRSGADAVGVLTLARAE